ncbi:MAG TPA: hypothetical protein K8V56_13685 [Sporosarcina psychrophila]|uniref:Uncharacterized protein n=1 Tax=Sporosarcina psychrophila TaxID=1476 RepID=A0A921G198_SPOPS|nr:hypothetical protein [Sporosarcina psychrophila]
MDGFREDEGKVLITTNRLCVFLEITDKTLTNWKRQGCPQHSRGWWDLQQVIKWRGVIQSGSDDPNAKKSVNLQQKKLVAEVAYKEAQAELTRIKTDIADGKYIEKEIVEAELTRFFMVFKKSAMSLSRKLSNVVGGYVEPLEARRVEKELTETINDALEQMSVDGVYSAKKKKR